MLTSTAYQLPFEFKFSAPPLWGTGVNTRIKIVLRVGESLVASRPTLQMKLMSFGVLCATGAFGVVPPKGFEPVTALFQSARTTDQYIEWTLPEWPASDDCLPVLASLYASGDVAPGVTRIEVASGTEAPNLLLRHEKRPPRCYPMVMRTLPFAYRILNDGQEEIRVALRLARVPSDAVRSEIEKMLQLWAHAACSGAYGVAPVEPLKCSFMFDRFVDWFDNRLTWHLKRFRAHPEALDGLINVVGTIHVNLWPISDCTID